MKISNSRIPALINDYSNLILAIENDENDDPLWRRFYQIQMAEYILQHFENELKLEKAKHAYKVIYRTWDDLNYYLKNPSITVKNLDKIFKSIHIEVEEMWD